MSTNHYDSIEQFALNRKVSSEHTLFAKIGIVGCGKEGSNIARICASAGIEVYFCEINQERVDNAFERITEALNTKIESWGLTEGEKKTILSRIHGSVDINTLADCEFVVEAVRYDITGVRDTELRKQTFRQLERILPPNVIIASNAATIIISELAADLQYKERCICVHFLVLQSDCGILEITKGIFTEQWVLDKVKQFAKLINHIPIEVGESAGMISLRLFLVMLNEASQMIMEGIGTLEDIDTIVNKGFGMNSKLFASADLIGIEKVIVLMQNLYDEYGAQKYKPSPVLMKLFRAKRYGISTGQGFYKY